MQPETPPWPTTCNSTEIKDKVLYFRGIKNFDATMDFLFENGLKDAEEFVLTGGSAGGLSTFLHTGAPVAFHEPTRVWGQTDLLTIADRIRARLEKEAPAVKRITAAPVVGYFLDHAVRSSYFAMPRSVTALILVAHCRTLPTTQQTTQTK